MSISRRDFLGATAAGAGMLGGFSTATSADETQNRKQPNLLFLCSDQQHWQAAGFVDPFFETPHLDQLAADGVSFDNAFCTTPQCSPSRSSLLSGFYPSTTGVYGNNGATGGAPLRHETIGTMLQRAGYRTGFFGKWHLGDDSVGNAGWDERNTRSRDAQTTDHGIEFLKKQANDDRPWALFLMYLNPHDIYRFRPNQNDVSALGVPLSESWHKETFEKKPSIHKKFMTQNQGTLIWGQEQPVWEQYRDFYRGKVKAVDDQYGRVLGSLEALGLRENTCTFATSDHGDMDTFHKLIFKGPFMYEHMVRVPFVARVPKAFGGMRGKRVDDFDTVLTDVVPTLLDFAGSKVPNCDGMSLKPLLTGEKPATKRDFVISQYYGKQKWVNPIRMIRTHEFKYNNYIEHGEELYDLKNDPEEIVNLAGDAGYRSVQKELSGLLANWVSEHRDPFYSLESNDSQLADPDFPGRRTPETPKVN